MDSTPAISPLTEVLPLITPAVERRTGRAPWFSDWARRTLIAKLDAMRGGQIVLHEGTDRPRLVLGACDAAATGPVFQLQVRRIEFYTTTVFGGHIGAAESYMLGDWDCDDLPGLIAHFIRNRDVLDGLDTGAAWLTRPLRALRHRLHRNTPRGSRLNIAAHYDLGNDFFARFLDPTMMYSCAVYERPDMDLDTAAVAKLDRICRKLDLQPDDHLVEIGTGWGGLALHAARHYGCRVTTTTLSREQRQLAVRRIASAGLADRVTVLLQDYRELEGQFDKLVSVEMIEAVGHEFYGDYFATCSRLLKPDGRMLVQAITIDDRLYERTKHEVDFIKRYIFPGSCIPSLNILATTAARHSDLQMVHLEDITHHYVRTLQDWRRRYLDALGDEALDAFHRMWIFYFCYCEAGFAERNIGNVQVVWDKPQARRSSILGRLDT